MKNKLIDSLSSNNLLRPFGLILAFELVIVISQYNIDFDCGKGTLLRHRNRRIIGGTVGNKGDWGWQAILRYNHRYSCGGSLIKNDWILTAAHCFSQSNIPIYYTVDIGVNNQKKPDAWSLLGLRVSQIFIHPYFNNRTYKNDIALVKLANKIKFDQIKFKITPVCISDYIDLTGKIAYATGFGTINQKNIFKSDYLRQVMLPVINDYTCQKYFRIVSSLQFCAGNQLEKYNTCRGDSGGPLVVRSKTNQRWYLIGITSWGYSCGGVYTRVGYYKNWIIQTINYIDSFYYNSHYNYGYYK